MAVTFKGWVGVAALVVGLVCLVKGKLAWATLCGAILVILAVLR